MQASDVRWQMQSRRFAGIGRVDLISRGPVVPDDAQRRDWLAGVARWHDGRMLLLNADRYFAPEALRHAGFWPLMTPATLALLPLRPEPVMRAALRQKWRNRLNKAERAGLQVTTSELTADHWLLRAEMEQAKARGYKGLPPGLCVAYALANPGRAVVFEALQQGRAVAGLLLLRHGRMATWQIGHSRTDGRRCHAMNLLLWRAMCFAAARGHDMLDLGTLNTQDAAGLARFKLGTGARAVRQSGTWLYQPALAPLARYLPLKLAA